jgi:hypothetical protein
MLAAVDDAAAMRRGSPIDVVVADRLTISYVQVCMCDVTCGVRRCVRITHITVTITARITL